MYGLILSLLAVNGGVVDVAPRNPAISEIAVYGDMRLGHVVHRALVEAILDANPDAVLVTGDLVQQDIPSDWAAFHAATADLRAEVPYFVSMGNHDRQGIFNESAYDEMFARGRWYEITVGDRLNVFVVDTNSSLTSASRQGQWLERRLRALEERETGFVVVMHHKPVFSSGPHGPEPSAVRDLRPLYEKHGVNLVLQGHDHVYERATLNGVTYLTSGGGGGPLYPRMTIQPETALFLSVHHWITLSVADTMEIEARDLSGNVFDRALITSRDRGHPATPTPSPSWIWVLLVFTGLATSAALTTRLVWSRRPPPSG